MHDSTAKKLQKELNSGLVGLVLLAVLDKSQEDLYGYEIAKRLASANEGTSLFKEGTIYPVLRALSAAELLTSRIVPSYSGPPRRYYRITEQGRAVLAEWKVIWYSTVSFVDRFIETGHSPEPQRAALSISTCSSYANNWRAKIPL
jgi:PadR family transcriptional regulator, regulatory protein PadR